LDTDSELIKIGFYVEMLTGQTTYNLWITNIRILEEDTSDYELYPPFLPRHSLLGYSVVLNWGEPQGFFGGTIEVEPIGYNVYRTQLNSDGGPIGETSLLNTDGLIQELWFKDPQLLTNVDYRYEVTAVYPNLKESNPDWGSVFVTIRTVTAPWEEDIVNNAVESDWSHIVPGWVYMTSEFTETTDSFVGSPWWSVEGMNSWDEEWKEYERLPLSFHYGHWANEIDGDWITENHEWLVSPSIKFADGQNHILLIDIALTQIPGLEKEDLVISDDARLALVLSTDNGKTWSTENILKEWIGDELLQLLVDVPDDYNVPVTPKTITSYLYPPYDLSESIKIGFYVEMLTGQTTYNLWITNITITTGTSEYDVTVPTPQIATLSNFPNPFNPETTISFSIPKEGIVEIDVYNVRGQRVTTLTNEFYTAGTHNITWNGRNQEGQSMGSGIYFYRLTTDGHTVTRRMMLLK
jgi:hypothetical protein